ncbi:hypothetical protein BGX26_004452 [Mortierella sp. AD094]|nr:hypothetical protein BGX26_004452 [Mortierella sp. AD094]
MMANSTRNIRSWISIKACVNDMFKMDNLQADVLKALYNLKPFPNQGIFEYIDQIKILVEGSGIDKTSKDHIKVIVRAFPDEGQVRIHIPSA